jgi:hypothetical protein
MNDMSSVIIPKSDQINADTLIAGPMTVTIKEVRINGGQEQPVTIVLEETPLFYRPCKSMSRCLVSAWGPDASKYTGRAMTLYRDPTVKWAGLEVGGIRISHLSHIDGEKQMMLTATKGSRKPHKVLPLKDAPQSNGTNGNDLGAWAHKFIASIGNVASLDKLEAGVSQVQAKIDALADAIPDAHAAVLAAIEAKRGSFAPADDDPFATSEPADHTPYIAGIERRIASAQDAATLDEIAEDLRSPPEGMDEAALDALEVKLGRRRRAVGKSD